MSNTTFDHSPSALEEKLAAYWGLVDERETIESRIAKAKVEKENVNERVFRKVITDYEETLELTIADLAPLKEEIDELRRSVDQEIKEIDAILEELDDAVAEVIFRHRVGEFDDAMLEKRTGELTPKVEESRRRREVLSEHLASMDRRRPDKPGQAEPASKTEPTERSPQGEPESSSGLENPQEWAEELELLELEEESLVPETPKPTPEPVATASNETDDDPLAAFNVPSPSAATSTAPSTQAATQVAASAPTYPNLTIRSGAHAGKIVPLLPITMSIGREHDNNVELKDPEVARYHARVLYEEGRYFVEDLESSTGTWINGVRERRRALDEGDVIRIGETELVFEFV